jgi:hypothetical protein
MKIRTSITAACAAAALGCTGAFLAPVMASAQSSQQTLKFTSVTTKQVTLAATRSTETIGQTAKNLNSKGKTIGLDVLYFVLHFKSHTAAGYVTVDTKGGFLYGTLTVGSTGKASGTVTGGTGAFSGATGTIKGKDLNKSGTRTAVTITYTT